MSQILREHCRKLLFIGILLLSTSVFAQDKDIDDVKKHAAELFDNGNYLEAKDLYSQLISLYPKDENYNYRFGACLLFVDVDKIYPLKFLEYAVSRPNVDVDAFYYLGKGYHYNYRFQDAIGYFNKYLAKLSAKTKNKLPAEQDIRYCENGLKLMRNITYPQVISKRKVNSADFYNSIKLADIGGRVLPAPKELHSATDKKKGYTPIMYKSNDREIIYFTSYGSGDKNGIDIFTVTVNAAGDLSKPIRLPETINTPYDEGFPFLSEDGGTFYFSSKGHNSMGGFDLFKANYDENANVYGAVKNLDYSVNTPDDDLMYADVPGEGFAFFASNRNCPKGKVYVYKINSIRTPYEIAVLSGKFDSKNTRSCKITVEDVDNHVKVGAYTTDKKSGAYVMRLRNGGTYNFLVEPYGGDVAYKGRVELPDLSDVKVLQQEIEIVEENGKEKLIIRNLFQEDAREGDQEIIAQVLLENADITEAEEPKLTISPAEMAKDVQKTKDVLAHHIGALKTKQTISYNLANEKREIAQRDLAVAEQLESQISLNDQSQENKRNQTELTQLLSDAKIHSNEAKMAFELGNAIGEQVTETEKKLNKTEGYLLRIQNSVQLGNEQASTESYQKFLADADVRKPNSLEKTIKENKAIEEQKMAKEVSKANNISTEQIAIKEDISIAKSELKATKKKKDKEPIQILITNLEVDLEPLEAQKEAAYRDARVHEKKANDLGNQLRIVGEVNENATTQAKIETVSLDQRTALIASIVATTNEIEALEVNSTDRVKNANNSTIETATAEQNTTEQNNADNELANNGNSENIDSENTDTDTGSENEDSNELSNPINEDEEEIADNSIEESTLTGESEIETTEGITNSASLESSSSSDSEFFEYTNEYEEPSNSVVLVDGVSVPLEITSNTGKRQYKVAELAGASISLTESSYTEEYKSEIQEAKTIESNLDKAKQTQSINYNWVVAMEKEVAELAYAKSQSNNSAYNTRIDTKVKNLNNKASQKRNFMALNAKIIKQLKTAEEEAVEEGEALIAENETNQDTEVDNASVGNVLNTDANSDVDTDTEAEQAEQIEQAEQTEVTELETGVTEQEIASNDENTEIAGTGVVAGNINQETTENDIENEGSSEESELVVNVTENQSEDTETALNTGTESGTEESSQNQVENNLETSVPETSVPETEDQENQQTEDESTSSEEGDVVINQSANELENSESQSLNTETASVPDQELEPIKLEVDKQMKISPTEVAIVEYQKAKEVQEAVVENKVSEVSNLQTELEVTRKKKKKRVIESQIAVAEADVQYEKRKLKLINEKKTAVVASQDAMISDPLSTRPSEEKFMEAKRYRIEAASLETQLEELEISLEATRKKKKKRVIEAEIQNVKNELVVAQLNQKMTLETAAQMEEIEVLTLKEYTNYGVEEMVKLPEVARVLTVNEEAEVKQYPEYQEYIRARNVSEKSIENASVLYQSATAKENEVKAIEEDIKLINEGMDLLPIEEQDSLRVLVVEKKQEQKKLIAEAEVYYKEAKSMTNDAYYNLNEANSKLLVMNRAQERTQIFALVGGNIEEPVVLVDSSNIDAIPTDLAQDIFINSDSTYYSDSKPIPVDVELPQGVILKVQIGAFRNPINQATFKGFAPIVGEKTPSGLTRYTAGLFKDFETANLAKSGIRAKGYSDAFVVAYLNGKRISITQARRIMAGEESSNSIVQTSNPVTQEPPSTDVSITVKTIDSKPISVGTENVKVAKANTRGDLYFTVQVGVYSIKIDPTSVFTISPLNTENIANNLIRYSSGVYGNVTDAINARNNIVANGISDAFVTAYYNGSRITVAEAKRLAGNSNSVTPTVPTSNENENQNTNSSNSESGVYYVTVGPYQGSIPVAQARTILGLGSLGVIVEKNNGATLYKIGNFTNRNEANALKVDLEAKGLINPTVVSGE